MDRFRTTTALPYAHLARATSTLRLELGKQIRSEDEWSRPDWSTMRVVGPVEAFGPHGVVHYEYQGSVERRRLAVLPNSRSRA